MKMRLETVNIPQQLISKDNILSYIYVYNDNSDIIFSQESSDYFQEYNYY